MEEPQVARNGEAEKEIKMRGRQRNSLTMWKRQILVERRSPATEGFAFIDAHQTFAARSGNGGLSKASPEANWDSRRALDDTERVHRVPFLFVGGRKKLLGPRALEKCA